MQEVCRCSWIQCLRIISKSDRTFAFEEKWTNKNFDIEVKVYFTSHRSSTSVEDEVLLRWAMKLSIFVFVVSYAYLIRLFCLFVINAIRFYADWILFVVILIFEDMFLWGTKFWVVGRDTILLDPVHCICMK